MSNTLGSKLKNNRYHFHSSPRSDNSLSLSVTCKTLMLMFILVVLEERLRDLMQSCKISNRLHNLRLRCCRTLGEGCKTCREDVSCEERLERAYLIKERM